MHRTRLIFCAVIGLVFLAHAAPAQEGIKVVPIGGSIQPEPAGEPGAKPRKRRVVPQASVKPGMTFMVESAGVLSSGINQTGETVYFRASEDVKGVIGRGALAKGRLSQVVNDKKAGKLVAQLQSIQALNGEAVDISGDVTVEGKGGQASLGVGERFTATIDEKAVVKKVPPSRKKKEEPAPVIKQAFAEIRGKGVKVDIKKGQSKGKVQVVLEPPKGVSVDDIDPSSFVLASVNSTDLPEAVQPIAGGKIVPGDRNKNGTTDLLFEFEAWDFVKYQPKGLNTVGFKGKAKDGSEYQATAKASIGY